MIPFHLMTNALLIVFEKHKLIDILIVIVKNSLDRDVLL